MIYPLNIFTEAPTGGIRPFIIFVIKDLQVQIGSAKSWSEVKNTATIKGGFVLPFPEGGLVDAVSHRYESDNAMMKGLIEGADKFGMNGGMASQLSGAVIDPLKTQTYQGTEPRTWSGTWQIVPTSLGEAAAFAAIMYEIKKNSAPSKDSVVGEIGVLGKPMVYDITFGNPIIQKAMAFKYMALTSYSIDYFAQGYASTTWDLMPKHMTLNMEFAEIGIKYREEW